MKILLVKLSSLGDVVHTLPVVQDIRAAMPDATIDWVLESSFAPLLSALAASGNGLYRIITCDIRRWRKSLWSAATWREWQAFKMQLQLENYDAVIDLQGLTKSALVARLARLAPGGKRYALANQTEGSGFEAPSRWAADVTIPMRPRIPAVDRSRELAAKALGYTFNATPDFGLKQAAAKRSQVQSAIKIVADRETVALLHGTSRIDKEWPTAHWVTLGSRLAASGYSIALAHGNARERATSQTIAEAIGQQVPGSVCTVWPVLALDALTVALGQCAGVVGVDSGVSHIAVALGLPHVQIYNFDTAWRTGPAAAPASVASGVAPQQVSVYASPSPDVDVVWQAWLACRQHVA